MYVPNSIKDLTITPVQSPGYYNGQPVTSVTVATSTISNDIPQCKNDAFKNINKNYGRIPVFRSKSNYLAQAVQRFFT